MTAAALRRENGALERVLAAVAADAGLAATAQFYLAGAPADDVTTNTPPMRPMPRTAGGNVRFADGASSTAATLETGFEKRGGLFRSVDETDDPSAETPAPRAPRTPESIPPPVRNEARTPDFVACEGSLSKRGTGKSFFGRNNWKQRTFQLVPRPASKYLRTFRPILSGPSRVFRGAGDASARGFAGLGRDGRRRRDHRPALSVRRSEEALENTRPGFAGRRGDRSRPAARRQEGAREPLLLHVGVADRRHRAPALREFCQSSDRVVRRCAVTNHSAGRPRNSPKFR